MSLNKNTIAPLQAPQKDEISGHEEQVGTLYIVATPLGNPGDLSPRARNILENVDLLLAEDNKRAGLAAARWELTTPKIISVNEHSEEQKIPHILSLLQEGKNLALISDAGMPILSDPGYLLVQECRKNFIHVTVIPGPCAPVTALAGSGIAPHPFVFFGFLPRKSNEIEKTLTPYFHIPVTLIFFERKDRIAQTLKHVYTLLGRREVCIARELTKTHEQYINFFLDTPPKLDHLLGEITVIIGPPLEKLRSSDTEILSAIEAESLYGGTVKEIAKRVQKQSHGWTNSEIYTLASRKRSE